MDDILGKHATDDTLLAKMAKKASMRKKGQIFFRIALAKVATLHWLKATGKARLPSLPLIWRHIACHSPDR